MSAGKKHFHDEISSGNIAILRQAREALEASEAYVAEIGWPSDLNLVQSALSAIDKALAQ